MKRLWTNPKVKNLTTKDTHTCEDKIQCNNSICISQCEVCGGCIGSKTKLQQCSYYRNLDIKICINAEKDGCKIPES